jgi:hypothetical protein
MRDKLNDSPAAQVGMILVLIVVAFVMFTRMGGSSSGGEEAAAPAESGTVVEGGTVTAAPEAAASAGSLAVTGSIPTPPLPKSVARAYRDNSTVVLLIVHDGGVDDKLVEESTRRLSTFPGTAVFIVPAKQIARYGAITLGTEVSQVPALVVVRPRRLSKGIPRATVSYGFQSEQGIEQALRDATYNGPQITYHPS